MPTILLTGGRAPATLHLARLFTAAGHRVLVAESLPLHLCHGSRAVARCFGVPAPNVDGAGFLAGLAKIVREEQVDLLVPTCEEVFHVARGAAEIPCKVFAPGWQQLRRMHHKFFFVRDLAARGVPVPRSWLVTSDLAMAAILGAMPADNKVVLKPAFSRFGTQVRIQTAGEGAPGVGASVRSPWVIQFFISGQPRCTYSLAHEGKLLAHSAYAPAFTEGANASIYFTPLQHPGLEAWVREYVAHGKLSGQLSFDFIEGEDDVIYPIECNPRATSGALLFEEKDRLDRAFLNQCDEVIRPAPGSRAMLGAAMWYYALPPALREGPWPLAHWASAVASARDAIFRWDDPLPGLNQFLMMGEFWRRAAGDGTTALEASTRDIEWNGA